MCGLTYLGHCEDASLVQAMNAGLNSTKLGLSGMPKAMEDRRGPPVRLAKLTGAKVHVCHVSSAKRRVVLGQARASGDLRDRWHYFTLTDDAVTTFDTNAKMNPPLREARMSRPSRRAAGRSTAS